MELMSASHSAITAPSRNWVLAPLFKGNAVACHNLAGQQSRFGTIPGDKFVDGMTIPALRVS